MGRATAAVISAALAVALAEARPDDPPSDQMKTMKAVSDPEFVRIASACGLAEVSLGMMGVQHASSPEVKHFAQTMVDDHTKANKELTSLADRLRIMPAPEMDPKHRMAADRLTQLQGRQFDHAFMKQVVADHEEAVRLFEAEARHGQNKDLRSLAEKMLPTLREHLKLAQDLASGKGGHDRSSHDGDHDGGLHR